ncbi:MAG: OmpA family protein [Saprospirales bacterium]|nr:OmpA family protein [Saprospirales bacterium]
MIEIGGHTNSTPPDEFCDRLSTARAKSAADYLIAKGVDPKRVVYKGYGKRNPVASNTTADGRRMNQRVEIKILALKRE